VCVCVVDNSYKMQLIGKLLWTHEVHNIMNNDKHSISGSYSIFKYFLQLCNRTAIFPITDEEIRLNEIK
jgi:hypothetical protein